MGLLSQDQFHLEDFLKFFIKSLKPLFKNALGPAESRLLHCITNITEKSSGKFERKKLKLSLDAFFFIVKWRYYGSKFAVTSAVREMLL